MVRLVKSISYGSLTISHFLYLLFILNLSHLSILCYFISKPKFLFGSLFFIVIFILVFLFKIL